MAGKTAVLATNKRRTIEALLTTPTIKQAAEAANVGERTVYRWLAQDAIFKAELIRREDMTIDAAARLLIAGTGKAIQILYELMNDHSIPHGIRLSAARAWLDHSLKVRELRDVESRLAALEAKEVEREG